MTHYTFSTHLFKDLSVDEFYNIARTRNDVFVIEQTCVYQDLDNKDRLDKSEHVQMKDGDTLVAYARVLAPSVSYIGSSIGRVLVVSDYRGKGAATSLMKYCINRALSLYPDYPIHIGAQCYLQAFYEGLGFEVVSEPYDEDGIRHVDMELKSLHSDT